MTAQATLSEPALIEELTALASRAGAAILRVRDAGHNAREKSDATPVTDADHAAEEIILAGLSKILPGIPVVSEEDQVRAATLQVPPAFVLVDPLDGTREFIAGRDEFTVNIAIVENRIPQSGVIGAPARHMIWRGVVGHGAQRLRLAADGVVLEETPIAVRRLPQPRTAVMSRSHLDPATQSFVTRWPGIEAVSAGSSLKFALIAEGAADIYPRLSPTCEWDIAAGHAIAVAAGGLVVTPEGGPLSYGRADRRFVVPSFVAWADPAAAERS